jgi:hypothetical protein
MSREAMQMALEALEDVPYMSNKDDYERLEKVTTALRQALETEQKPVAWMYTSQWKSNERFITTYQSELTTYKADKVWPLYTAPQKKEWVGLTDEEISAVDWKPNETLHDYARHIELKLRGKNT